ncbi:MAG: tRNA (N(6)-L-threonylcarbamoyladenosine(37)-C(2))-methylthiotransferase [Candidatus Micrarchaeaceae archaeon]
MEKIAIETYGCTLNQADSEMIEERLKEIGYEISDEGETVIINTCTVKTPTEQKILHRIKELNEKGKRLIVTGCLANASPEKIMHCAPNAIILNSSRIGHIEEAVENSRSILEFKFEEKPLWLIRNKGVIAKIPISEGCLSSCTFCETKYARGPLRSYEENIILKAVKNCVEKGAKEIELTSQDVGAYGADRKTNIAELVKNICEIEGDFKVRIGMLNPEHIHKYFDELMEAMKDRHIYKFLHLPVQSGSNKVLREMKRNYTIEEYEGCIEEIRRRISGITIHTDIIVGYPTETDEDFNETIMMLERVRPTVTNVSKFGARPHTYASRLKQIENRKVKERSTLASRIARKITYETLQKELNKEMRVLITEKSERSYLSRSDSYVQVAINGEAELGSYVNVKILRASSSCLVGEVCV